MFVGEIALDAMKAFDRLERSGGGFVVPFVLFCFGMLVTVAACLAIRDLDARIERRLRDQQEQSPQDTMVYISEAVVHVNV